MAATVRDIRAGKGFKQPEPGLPNVVSEKRKRKIPFTFAPIPASFLGWIPHLTSSELRVYMAVFSQTLAFNKWAATIPMTEIARLTNGMSRYTIYRAIKSLEENKLLRVGRGVKRVSRYEILTTRYVCHGCNTEDAGNVSPVQHEDAV